ncbi:MAG TPA: lysophospholipase [Bacteroidales bacterium]|jgi:alpha-beta hydrolase superfamily lysophospholipase|nr:lysophospholipase [Bacteroidales bacterium]HQH25176.1 lysophospholipase [Bacteroidales bacterium]HQJ82403.1 lysophospholipase [Bacteroidales bacterium]
MKYSIKLRNGQILRGLIVSPGENARANIVFVHGLGEHIGRYVPWAELFRNAGIGFTGVDLPGHGSSGGKRGHIRSYDLTDEMIDLLISHTGSAFTGVPVFLYGHSLGGNIVLDYLLRKTPGIAGAVVTSPWLILRAQPGKSKLVLASAMKYVLPGLTQASGLNPEHLSRDRDVVERYLADPLVHERISVSLFHNAAGAAKNSLSASSSLKVPLLLMHGSDDQITSPEGSREFASGNNLTEIKIWDDGYHELHNEPFREEVFSFITDWINRMSA